MYPVTPAGPAPSRQEGVGGRRYVLAQEVCDEISAELPSDPDSAIPETVYRVVQEALTNALRHAPGSSVRVEIVGAVDHIAVTVADDGPGSAAETRRGYGLIGLAERLQQAGGSLATRSSPEIPGFEVTAVLPHRAEVDTP